MKEPSNHDFLNATVAPQKKLLQEAAVALETMLDFRSFPANRRGFALDQVDRLKQLSRRRIPAYYFEKRIDELEWLRHRREAIPMGYVPRITINGERTPEQDAYLLAQLIAIEARIIEAHYESRTTFPKTAKALAEAIVERMRLAALASPKPEARY